MYKKIAAVLITAVLLAGCQKGSPIEKYDDGSNFGNRTENGKIIEEEPVEKTDKEKVEDIYNEMSSKDKENAEKESTGETAKKEKTDTDITSDSYKAVSDFLKKLSAEDYEGIYNMLDLPEKSFVRQSDIEKNLKESDLAAVFGKNPSIVSCTQSNGGSDVYAEVNVVGSIMVFHFVKAKDGWKADLSSAYNIYEKDKKVVFPDTDNIKINGISMSEVKDAPDVIYDSGFVMYKITYPNNAEITMSVGDFEEKKANMQPTPNEKKFDATCEYVVSDEEAVLKMTEDTVNILNTICIQEGDDADESKDKKEDSDKEEEEETYAEKDEDDEDSEEDNEDSGAGSTEPAPEEEPFDYKKYSGLFGKGVKKKVIKDTVTGMLESYKKSGARNVRYVAAEDGVRVSAVSKNVFCIVIPMRTAYSVDYSNFYKDIRGMFYIQNDDGEYKLKSVVYIQDTGGEVMR